MLAIKNEMKFVDWVWLSESDKKEFNNLSINNEFESIVINDSNSNEYVLKKELISSFYHSKCSFIKFQEFLSKINNEYFVRIRNGLITFHSLSYYFPTKDIYSPMIEDFGNYDLILYIVDNKYLSFVFSNSKNYSAGYVMYENENINIYIEQEDKIGKLSKNVIASFLSECI